MTSAESSTYDIAIVGGGIVGLATAHELIQRVPTRRLIIVEKESALARHQTGRNSGVIHSGIYYRPGSLKAQTCVAGAQLMRAFCDAHGIRYELCGKLVVATRPDESPALERLYQRGLANGVPGLSLIGSERIRELEPHARGVNALHVASAGIVDYVAVANALARLIQQRGATLRLGTRVLRLIRRDGAWVLETTGGAIQARWLIACAGLQSDRLARLSGGPSDVAIVPFRGDYYELVPPRRSLVHAMIYPVPDPALPFLGVHFTRGIDGSVHAGPNAVLALAREGYRKTDVSVRDTLELIRFRGFWPMAAKFWKIGLEESWCAISKRAFVRVLQRLVPEVRAEDLHPAPSGIRAQAVDRQGTLLNDFNIVQAEGALHVRNVPSPAATASLRIGQLICDLAVRAFSL